MSAGSHGSALRIGCELAAPHVSELTWARLLAPNGGDDVFARTIFKIVSSPLRRARAGGIHRHDDTGREDG
ncbi:MAG: hypothetical protein AAGA70_18705 [Pseudomonadota bacterium]